MDHKKRKQRLSESQSVDQSLSEMNPKKKKKQKMSKPQLITSPLLSEMELQQGMKKQNDVAMVLTGEVIATKARNSNFVFSPTSFNVALAMVNASSPSDHSDSKMQQALFGEIATIVFADRSTTGGPNIRAINGVWVEQSLPFDPLSKDLLENVFKATFNLVDFRSKGEQVRLEVNDWASHHTNGLIKDLLPNRSVTRDTIIIYGNALYFKGVWKKPFDKAKTKEKEFHLINRETLSVPFMISHEYQYIAAYDGFKVLKLPYRQGPEDTNCEFSMYFYLPDKKDGLHNLSKRMTSTPGFVDSHIPEHKYAGEFRIPKFKISFNYKKKLSDNKGLMGEEITMYHQAFVEIDEEGAEAAAVTTAPGQLVGLSRYRQPPPKRINFVADHPFLFLIREDKTGTICFAGQIYNPK